VADGFCEIAIGTDTGGSCRIPASFCGIVGYKPTARLVPKEGALALSYSLDSIGPLASSVADCALTHAVLAGEAPVAPARISAAGLRLGVLTGPLLEDLDATAGGAFEAACRRLSAAGAHLSDFRTERLAEMQTAIATCSFSPVEALYVHREYFETRKADFDQRVWQRIAAARSSTAADYVHIERERLRLIAALDAEMAPFDALILPTTPNVAPNIAETDASDEAFFAQNVRGLRNTAFVNLFDLCAISLPMPTGALPVGLQLISRNGADARLFAVAAAVRDPFAARRCQLADPDRK
jgi:aspartyl-tRNA(Asn)/glutamyl-tRNA(Gln) amidotransferase subunit A